MTEFLTSIRSLWQALHATNAEYTRCRQRKGSCSGPLSRSCPLCDSLPGPRSRYVEYRLRSCGVSGRYERRSAGRLSGIVQCPRTIELCYFPVFRVRPWTDEPFIGDVRAQQLRATPGPELQVKDGSQCVGRHRSVRVGVGDAASTRTAYAYVRRGGGWWCGCTWSKCIGLSSERLAAADPCAFPPQCILLALFNFSRGVVGQPTTRLGGFFFFALDWKETTTQRFVQRPECQSQFNTGGLGTPDLPQEETITYIESLVLCFIPATLSG